LQYFVRQQMEAEECRRGGEKRKFMEIHRFLGPTTQEALFTSQSKKCVCVIAPGMRFPCQKREGLWVLLAQGSWMADFLGSLQSRTWRCHFLHVLEATVMIEQWQSFMLGQGRCHQCDMALQVKTDAHGRTCTHTRPFQRSHYIISLASCGCSS